MKVLGAILAGGKSSRFGSDKGAALLNGKALIDHVADGLRPQVEDLIICGRQWPGLVSIADRPAHDLGPLGGLCGALHYAADKGFEVVVTSGCDVLPVPDLPRISRLLQRAEVIQDHWLFGVWPASMASQLDHHLSSDPDRSMRHWIETSNARIVTSDTRFHNINTPDDFALYCADQGLVA